MLCLYKSVLHFLIRESLKLKANFAIKMDCHVYSGYYKKKSHLIYTNAITLVITYYSDLDLSI